MGQRFPQRVSCHHLDNSDADAIATLQSFFKDVPSPHTDVKLMRLGSALSAVGEDDTAFSFDQPRYALVIQTRWEDPAVTAEQMEWTHKFHTAMVQYGNSKVYSNFVGHEPKQRVADVYNSRSYKRLRKLNKQYDPHNLFRMNVNIMPAVD